VLGAGTTAFATPFALGYALHVRRRGVSPVLGRVAVALATLEALACLALVVLWLWNFLA
jgi:hypothetical protein